MVKKGGNKAPKQQKDVRTVECTEEVDPRLVSYLIQNFDTIPDCVETIDGEIVSKASQLTILNNYKRKIKDGKAVTIYAQIKGVGRMFGKNCFQGMKRVIRHTLARDLYYDIDICNAHPVLLVKYCDDNQIPCDNLKDYVANRDLHFQEYMQEFKCDRDTAKKAYLQALNGGGSIKDNKGMRFINYFKETVDIREKVTKLEAQFFATAKKRAAAKLKKNPKAFASVEGSCLNLLMCDLEHQTLMYMREYLLSQNVVVGTLVFDGLMIRRGDHYDLNAILRGTEQAVLQRSGVTLSIVEKPMDQGMNITEDQLKEVKPLPYEDIDMWDIKRRDDGLAKIYKQLVGDDVKIVDKEGNGYVWSSEKLIWEELQAIHIQNTVGTVLEPVIKHFSCFASTKKEFEVYEKILDNVLTTRGKNNIFQTLKTLLKDSEFETKINVAVKHELPIKGGMVINLKTKEVRLRQKTDLWSFECPVEYLHGHDLARAKSYFESLMHVDRDEPDPARFELLRCFQVILGYSITGETSEKKLFVFYGPRADNGKSTVVKLLKMILTDHLYTTLAKGVLMKHGQPSSCTPELVPLIGRRIGVMNDTGKDGMRLSDNVLTLTGGEDEETIRGLYQSYSSHELYCTLILCCNCIPKWDAGHPGLKERLKFIPFDNKFEKTIENLAYIESLKKDGLSELFTWIVDGAAIWYEKGLQLSDLVNRCTTKTFGKVNNVIPFIQLYKVDDGKDETGKKREIDNEDGTKSNAPIGIDNDNLYRSYVLFCNEEKEEPVSQLTFVELACQQPMIGRTWRRKNGLYYMKIIAKTAKEVEEERIRDGEIDPEDAQPGINPIAEAEEELDED